MNRTAFSYGNRTTEITLFFLDSCFLTGKSTQVIQFSATYFTILVNRDAFDKRRFDRENTFYTYVFRHLTHCEAFFVTMT